VKTVQRPDKEETPIVTHSLDKRSGQDEGENHGEHVRNNINTRPSSRVMSDGLIKYWEIIFNFDK
jgi:hypothetical protein